MVHISLDYVIKRSVRVNLALRQDFKYMLLPVSNECKLFMIFFPNRNENEHIKYITGPIVYIWGHVILL